MRGIDGLIDGIYDKKANKKAIIKAIVDNITSTDEEMIDIVNESHDETYRINFEFAANEIIRQLKGG